ncbi:dihydroorotase [Tuberibacillus sp. Marseille-P3662]|uniref:dihydroorotase n=1 Tax=Tuberibacillus sp. Marseille-P3662 TaxID=1965358 RepID=UPI000A1CEE93|nr:dihydroorotase [Tuberibacillus sp. Marseille-P3662]
MGLLLKSGQVYSNGCIEQKDVFIEGGIIRRISDHIPKDGQDVIDAEGLLVTPGFVDVHVHLREPGGEHKETIRTGTKAAAKGGFTTVCAMPNTNPVPDNDETMVQLHHTIQRQAVVDVLPYASITQGLSGHTLSDFRSLKEAGAFAFTDDGVGVQSASMMLEAMQRAANLDMPVVAHCEENSLINDGCVHDGWFAREHGLRGIPNVCEATQVARDVLLAEAAGVHYHVCHVSTKETVRVIRDAKRAGIRVTAEVTPHHLLLTENDIPDLDPNFKMNPPLRSVADREALIEGLLDGTIDMIATDHAPHAAEEKAQGMEKAPFGIVGLETAFSLLYSHLVQRGVLTLEQLLERLAHIPAQIFGVNGGILMEGGPADVTFIDLSQEQVIQPHEQVSKGQNTPFMGWSCHGLPVMTLKAGRAVYEQRRLIV